MLHKIFEILEPKVYELLHTNLPKDLFYHGAHHTKDVVNAAVKIAIAEAIDDEDLGLVKIAALFHDTGFLEVYKGHEEISCNIAKSQLDEFNLSNDQMSKIISMIMATKIPQTAEGKLEQIMADADLDYLGREDFFPIANSLFKEVEIYLNITNENEWNKIQVGFLEKHKYFTNFSKEFRNPSKLKHIEEVKKLIV